MLIFPSCPTELLHTQLCPPAPKPTEAFGVSKAGDGRKDQDLAEVIKKNSLLFNPGPALRGKDKQKV